MSGNYANVKKLIQNFEKGAPIYGTPYLWNFDVKYCKICIQKLKEKCKKILAIVSGAFFHHISFTSAPFGVNSLFCHIQHILCPNPRLHFSSCFWVIANASRQVLHRVCAPKAPNIPQGHLSGLFWYVSWEGCIN